MLARQTAADESIELLVLAAFSSQIDLHSSYGRKKAYKRPYKAKPDADIPVKARVCRRRVGQRCQIETAEDG